MQKGVEARGVFLDEFAIENRTGIPFLRGQHFFHDTAQRSHVTVEPDRQPEIAQSLTLVEEHAGGVFQRVPIFLRIGINHLH